MLVAAIGAFDLRLMGLAMRGARVSELARRLFPWACVAFAVQVLSGGLLFSSEATRMVVNPAFRIKLILIGLGGIHAFVFRWIACRDMPDWDSSTLHAMEGKNRGFGVDSDLGWGGCGGAVDRVYLK